MAKEVAPQGKQVTDLEAEAQLKSILKDQLCFALYSDGEVVAKANTNAIGYNYVQLGGVYTHPLYRKNYYAWNLVYTICSRVIKTGRKISLFVKEKNNPAHTLYDRIGFESLKHFRENGDDVDAHGVCFEIFRKITDFGSNCSLRL